MTAPPRGAALAPFTIRSFRFQWPSDLATSWAFEMETLILGWYILVESGSVFLLTVFASLQFAGTLVAPAFGLAGDRIGHCNLLRLMRGTYALLAAAVLALYLVDALSAALVLLIAGCSGMVRPSEMSVRTVLVSEIMPPGLLMSAIGLSRITTDSARVAGALAGAGVVALLGMGWAYAMVIAFYATSVALTFGIAGRPANMALAPRGSPWRELREAARSIQEAPAQLAAMLLAFLINLTAYPFILGLLPFVARDVYGTGQTGLGYLIASAAAGAIVAALLLSRLGATVKPARAMLLASLAWHALLIVFGWTGGFIPGIGLLFAIGMAQGFCILPMAVLLLRGAAPELRGRIMGMRTLAVYGLPVGLLTAAPVIDTIGFTGTASVYGTAGFAATFAILLRWRASLWPPDAPANEG